MVNTRSGAGLWCLVPRPRHNTLKLVMLCSCSFCIAVVSWDLNLVFPIFQSNRPRSVTHTSYWCFASRPSSAVNSESSTDLWTWQPLKLPGCQLWIFDGTSPITLSSRHFVHRSIRPRAKHENSPRCCFTMVQRFLMRKRFTKLFY